MSDNAAPKPLPAVFSTSRLTLTDPVVPAADPLTPADPTPPAAAQPAAVQPAAKPADPAPTPPPAAPTAKPATPPANKPGPNAPGPNKPGPGGPGKPGGPNQKGPGQGGPNKPGPHAKPGPRPEVVVRPVAEPARSKRRHWGLLLSFLILVAGPVGLTWAYLANRAVDQYGSDLGFTVRTEDTANAADLLGGLGAAIGVPSGGGQESDILYSFIRSQEIVATIDAQLDLRSLYSRHTDTDPIFGFHTEGRFLGFPVDGTIEDLTDYWQRMVRISYDQTSGLMEVTALAFTPDEAQAIAQAIYDASLARINELSAQAQTDATRYANEDLDLAIERLKVAREAFTAFRVANQIVDLEADIQGQMGLLNALQVELAAALVSFDLLAQTSRENDPRMEQARNLIAVLEGRIEEERAKFGSGVSVDGDVSYATTVAEFERLTVEREIAEQRYLAAVALYDSAVADASRQSLYLAAYIQPTLAEKSQYPQHGLIIGLVALFTFLGWSILALVYYSLRDRR